MWIVFALDDRIFVEFVKAHFFFLRHIRYLMAASCGGDVVDEGLVNHFHDMGLEAQHAYSVLDVQQIENTRFL